MPDFVRPVYAERPWYPDAVARFTPLQGSQQRLAISARKRWLDLIGTLGGKWPHTGSIQSGARPAPRCRRAPAPADPRSRVPAVSGRRAVRPRRWSVSMVSPAKASSGHGHAEAPGQGDFRQFLQIALDTGAWSIWGRGRGCIFPTGRIREPMARWCSRAACGMASPNVYKRWTWTISAKTARMPGSTTLAARATRPTGKPSR